MYFASSHLQDEKIEVPHTWALVLSIQVMDRVGVLDHLVIAIPLILHLSGFPKRIWKGISTQGDMVEDALRFVFLSDAQDMARKVAACTLCHREQSLFVPRYSVYVSTIQRLFCVHGQRRVVALALVQQIFSHHGYSSR